jgi:hypothetical protein
MMARMMARMMVRETKTSTKAPNATDVRAQAFFGVN